MDLHTGAGYCDLNICCSGDAKVDLQLLRRAFELGYQTVALNVNVHQKNLGTAREAKLAAKQSAANKVMLDFPPAPKVDLDPAKDYPELHSKGKAPKVLTRLTLSFTSNDFLPIFNRSANAKGYDLLALIPDSTLALQNLLKSGFRADIIAFDTDPENNGSGNVKWSRKLYMECVEKHMFFEIPYAPAIRDPGSTRRKVIRQAHIYHSSGKSRKIVVSSAAKSPIELRAPHDVANLGHLFNLNEQQGNASVSSMARDAVKSGAGRRLGPYRCIAQIKSQLGEDEAWKVPSDPKKMRLDGKDKDGDSSSSEEDSDDDNNDAKADEQPMKVYD